MHETTLQYFDVNITTSTVMCCGLLIVTESLYIASWVALFSMQDPVSRAMRH
jgi:hypothetical protein